MGGSILKKLLQRYTSGRAGAAERFIVDKWYDSFDHDIIITPGLQSENETETTRDRVYQTILHKQLHPVIHWYQRTGVRIAASLLIIGTVLALVYINQKENPIQLTVFATGNGQIKKITLADSTRVWLNANSRFSISAGYARNNRDILLSGEAYFEVTPDAAHPFIITSGNISTKVLGTSFNVSAYPEMSWLSVAVSTGKVAVNDGSKLLSLLTPGKSLRFEKNTGQSTVSEVNVERITGWRTGRILLDDVSYGELAATFSNMFDKQLQTDDPSVKKLRFRLMLDNTLTAEENVAVITGIHQLQYKYIDDQTIVILKAR